MKNSILILLFCSFLMLSCSTIRDSAGVNRKSIDEYNVIENPPLVIPPDFNLLPPDQLAMKNIEDADKELAKEILFGLDESNSNSNSSTSTMENILKNVNTNTLNNNIRSEIDEEFANEKSTSNYQKEWQNKSDILDSIEESKRLRSQLLDSDSNKIDNETIKENKTKSKKRKFFFF